MADPFALWTAEQIAAASQCPLANVRTHWPKIVEQLTHCGIADEPVLIAAIGTIAIETASQFAPVREAFWLDEEWRRTHLSYYPWYGRGEIQLTHEANYRTYGKAVDDLWHAGGAIDLIARPDDALDPDVSAAVLACYFKATNVMAPARAGDWLSVRRKVYGGTDEAGAARIGQIAGTLRAGAPPPTTLSYNPNTPPQRQVQNWTCSIRATAWMLASLGVYVDIGALQDEMSPKYVTPADGLLDARGYGIAATVKAHLPGEWQDKVHVMETITWDELASLAGSGPVALGLRAAYHWINVAKPIEDGALSSPNPAPNYPPAGPIGDTLTRAEFDRWGPSSAVWVNAAVTPTPPPPDPTPALIAQQLDIIHNAEAEIRRLTGVS